MQRNIKLLFLFKILSPLKTKYPKKGGLSNHSKNKPRPPHSLKIILHYIFLNFNLDEILSQNCFTLKNLPALFEDIKLVTSRIEVGEQKLFGMGF